MKDVGRTINGCYLVQMTPEEHRQLGYLQEAMKGKTWKDPELRMLQTVPLTDDEETILHFLVTFVSAKFLVNELAQNVQELQERLTTY